MFESHKKGRHLEKSTSILLIGYRLYNSLESDCVIDKEMTKGASKILHQMLPPDWAVAVISKLSGVTVIQLVDAVKQVPCREIALILGMRSLVMGHAFIGHIQKPLLVLKTIILQSICP